MGNTIDGFPVQNELNFLPVGVVDFNQWSHNRTIQIEVALDDYWQNLMNGEYRKPVIWKGKTVQIFDYEWFVSIIKQWTSDKNYPLTKEQAIDLWFSV